MRVIVPALLASAALLLASVPAASPAQEVVQPLPGTTDADRLAEQMRALAANQVHLTKQQSRQLRVHITRAIVRARGRSAAIM